MDQGTVKVERRAGFWAWTVSIAVHLLVLAVLAVAKFSPSKADALVYPGAVAKMSVIRKLAETPRLIPKPKMSWQKRLSWQPKGLTVDHPESNLPDPAYAAVPKHRLTRG